MPWTRKNKVSQGVCGGFSYGNLKNHQLAAVHPVAAVPVKGIYDNTSMLKGVRVP